MVEGTASLTGGRGELEVTLDFSRPGETGQTTQSTAIRVEVDGEVARLSEN